MQRSEYENLNYKKALSNKCPNCLEGDIYSSVLTVTEKCDKCGFQLSKHDVADGPAFFVMCITCVVITLLALVLDFVFSISLLMQVIFLTPVTIILSIYLLRIIKSLLIHLEYKHNVNNYRK